MIKPLIRRIFQRVLVGVGGRGFLRTVSEVFVLRMRWFSFSHLVDYMSVFCSSILITDHLISLFFSADKVSTRPTLRSEIVHLLYTII